VPRFFDGGFFEKPLTSIDDLRREVGIVDVVVFGVGVVVFVVTLTASIDDDLLFFSLLVLEAVWLFGLLSLLLLSSLLSRVREPTAAAAVVVVTAFVDGGG